MLVVLLGLLLLATAAPAQPCCGDCDGDDRVTVSELVTTVRNNLAGCANADCCGDCNGSGEVRVNEVIRSVDNAFEDCAEVRFCTLDLSASESTACTFRGRFNGSCGGRLNVRIVASGGLVLAAVNISGRTLAHPDRGSYGPVSTLFIEARMASPTDASLVDWYTREDRSDLTQLLGTLSISDGKHLIIEPFPADVPFTLDDCKFKRFEGDLLRVE